MAKAVTTFIFALVVIILRVIFPKDSGNLDCKDERECKYHHAYPHIYRVHDAIESASNGIGCVNPSLDGEAQSHYQSGGVYDAHPENFSGGTESIADACYEVHCRR